MTKPDQTTTGLINISVANFGTAIAFALQQGNMARIFQTLGADLASLPMLMIAGPVTGLIIQPLVGHFSDRHWGRFGRRRPFFLGGAVFAGAAMVAMPYASTLLVAAALLWILDAALNVAIEPFRAFVAEMTPERQRAAGLAFNAAFGCCGAIVGFALPFLIARLGISNVATPGHVPPSVEWSLILAGAVLVGAVAWTVATTREYAPDELQAFGDAGETGTQDQILRPASGFWWLLAGATLSGVVAAFDLSYQFYIVTGGLAAFGVLQIANRTWPRDHALAHILSDLAGMPVAMRKLAAIHFFTWFALFIMWPFMTPVVTQRAFGATDPASAAYQAGADWVGLLFVGFNVAAVAFSFLALPRLARRFGDAPTHAACLATGAAGFALMFAIRDPYALLIPFAALGVAWASLLTLPYVMLTRAVPSNRFGVYIGLFNIFIVLPQIVAAAGMGPLLTAWFPTEPVWTMAFGGGAMGIAALLTLVLRPDRAS
jgi:maltose/moltooligosaccharide transporter